jgi:hypothetical protein
VETPVDAWQLSLNKEVHLDDVTAILREAKQRGWRGAKFYFMVGLPTACTGTPAEKMEEEEIVGFVLEAARKTGMHFNINAGTFIPKPHTSYQWEAQINEEDARKKLEYIRSGLKSRGHKVGVQDPFISVIEGVISRGDERVGEIVEEAFLLGCRLDAWNEYLKKDVWRSLFAKYGDPVRESLSGRDRGKPLPWSCVDSGVSEHFLSRELDKSTGGTLRSACAADCDHPCGVCSSGDRVITNGISPELKPDDAAPAAAEPATLPAHTKDRETYRIVFSFVKEGPAVFLSHLSVIEVFSQAMFRAGIPVLFSRGFHPLPKIDFASPLSLGIFADGEIATLDTDGFYSPQDFIGALNPELPGGFRVNEAIGICIMSGAKKHSAASLLWGFSYEMPGRDPVYVPATEEKKYRSRYTESPGTIFGLRRKSVLARSPADPAQAESYFSVYKALYGGTSD